VDMTMVVLHPTFSLLHWVGVIYVQLRKFRCTAGAGDEGADAVYKLTSDAKGVTTTLTRNRVIDVDPEGGEGKSVIVVANMLTELNTL
jgi:hypothetical protein